PAGARGATRGEAEIARHRPTRRRGPPASARNHPSPGQALLARGREVHRVPESGMSARLAAALLVVAIAAAGCGGGRGRVASIPATPSACMRLQGERQVRGRALCEDVFSCYMPPKGVVDRIGLRRVAPCEGATGPVVLYLPGMHMNGEIAGTSA